MKICFVDPNYLLANTNAEISVGLLTVATALRDADDTHDLFYLNPKESPHVSQSEVAQKYANEIYYLNPDVVMITTRIDYYLFVLYLSNYLREIGYEGKIILGGPQATHTAEETLKTWKSIDFIIIGEGEVTAPELIFALENNSNLNDVKGIMFRTEKKIVCTEERARLQEISIIPDYKLVFPIIKKFKQKYIRVEAGRGCAYRCLYCSTSVMWHGTDILKDAKILLKEMYTLKKESDIDGFIFEKDNLIIKNKKSIDFLKNIAKYNIHHFKWKCSVRIDCLSEEIIKLLKKAGCIEVYLGIETGSKKMQRIYRKNLDMDKIYKNIKILDNEGIGFIASFICGHPEETKSDIEETIKLAIHLSTLSVCREIQIHKLAVTPGSDMYREHFFRLNVSKDMSDQAKSDIELSEFDWKIIGDNKNIFSAFYSLPIENEEVQYTIKHIEQFGIILNNFARTVQVMKKTGIAAFDACKAVIDEKPVLYEDDMLAEVYKYERRVYNLLLESVENTSFTCFLRFNPSKSGIVIENCFVKVVKEKNELHMEVKVIKDVFSKDTL